MNKFLFTLHLHVFFLFDEFFGKMGFHTPHPSRHRDKDRDRDEDRDRNSKEMTFGIPPTENDAHFQQRSGFRPLNTKCFCRNLKGKTATGGNSTAFWHRLFQTCADEAVFLGGNVE